MEKWKPVPGWEDRYAVSSLGRVRSVDMRVGAAHGSTAVRKGRILVAVVKGGRYLCVTLADRGRRVQLLVHDAVALAFRGPKPKGQVTRHLDDDRLNNTLGNIRYGTKAQNEADRMRNGKVARGEAHGCAKLSAEEVLAIRAADKTPAELSLAYGVTAAHVHAIRTRRVWRHI